MKHEVSLTWCTVGDIKLLVHCKIELKENCQSCWFVTLNFLPRKVIVGLAVNLDSWPSRETWIDKSEIDK